MSNIGEIFTRLYPEFTDKQVKIVLIMINKNKYLSRADLMEFKYPRSTVSDTIRKLEIAHLIDKKNTGKKFAGRPQISYRINNVFMDKLAQFIDTGRLS